MLDILTGHALDAFAQRNVEMLGGCTDDALRLVGEADAEYRVRAGALIRSLIDAGEERGRRQFLRDGRLRLD